MLLEHRPDLARDPLILGQLNATNIFTADKHDVADLKTDGMKKPENVQNAKSSSSSSSSLSSSSSSSSSSESGEA